MKRVLVRACIAIDKEGNYNIVGFGKVGHEQNLDAAMELAVEGVSEGENRFIADLMVTQPDDSVPAAAVMAIEKVAA